eukprot:2706485-Lingulodinium_polyedra.AAC.1
MQVHGAANGAASRRRRPKRPIHAGSHSSSARKPPTHPPFCEGSDLAAVANTLLASGRGVATQSYAWAA